MTVISHTPPSTNGIAETLQSFAGRPGAGIFLFLVVFLPVISFFAPQMLQEANLAGILNQMVFIFIPTLGMTIVIISGGIDLSVGSVIGLSGGVAASLLGIGLPLPLALLAGIAAGSAIGFLNGIVITRLKVPDFVATLAMMGVVRGALYVWTSGIPFRNYMDPAYYLIGGLRMVAGKLTLPVFVALALLLILTFVLKRTYIGAHFRATGSNAEAARLSGIRPDRVKLTAYIASGTLAAITGVMLAGRLTTVHPAMGAGYELETIAAAVMGGAALSGGRGSFWGALVGALTLTVIQNAINILNIESTWENIIIGGIILFAVLIDRAAMALSRTALRSRPH
ncbi:ABC transporter permease [Mesorhizobium sp. BR1-1-16]|uniref:ABC transporter permease n=1 Tax=Mesorhizobium sp. BR1-1-16 TaxID=2876653 RepID=UPI001CCAA6B6|nr:ABC transporter permease [Mesorhizobium sp. BR1-1-16]MBZ9938963.1 ABC transporter permease [Mesorhizobium sp. BR1-1-16]